MKIALVLFSLFFAHPLSANTQTPDLIVYLYDSLAAKGGLSEQFGAFEAKCHCRVRALPSGDGGQLLSRLELDVSRGKPKAHVVMGLDQNLFPKAKKWIEPWGDWRPSGWERLKKEVRVFPPADGFLPFDYGVFALMADRLALKQAGIPVPKSLRDLLLPAFKRNLILEDPRTSTPGLSFLLFTEEVFGRDDARNFWKRLKTQWLTLAPGWDGAYGLFLKKEAPLVWSYVTSEAYHLAHGDKEGRYQALLFNEGQPIQIEGAALVRGAFQNPADKKRAESFLEFLISNGFQEKVPEKNWMLPVLKGVRLPPAFQKLPIPKKFSPILRSEEEIKESLKNWNETVR